MKKKKGRNWRYCHRYIFFFLFVSLQMRLFSLTKKANVPAQGADEDDA